MLKRTQRPAIELVSFPIGDRPRPRAVRKLADHFCFQNALRYAMRYGWRYCEGLAGPPRVASPEIHHAWCLDERGVVVETTWHALGTQYLGLVYDMKAVIRRQFGSRLAPFETPSMRPNYVYYAALERARGSRSPQPDHPGLPR